MTAVAVIAANVPKWLLTAIRSASVLSNVSPIAVARNAVPTAVVVNAARVRVTRTCVSIKNVCVSRSVTGKPAVTMGVAAAVERVAKEPFVKISCVHYARAVARNAARTVVAAVAANAPMWRLIVTTTNALSHVSPTAQVWNAATMVVVWRVAPVGARRNFVSTGPASASPYAKKRAVAVTMDVVIVAAAVREIPPATMACACPVVATAKNAEMMVAAPTAASVPAWPLIAWVVRVA
jgi:hypothetical protein